MERRPRIFVKLGFRELCSSKLSGLHHFDNMAINSMSQNRLKKKRQTVSHETPILEHGTKTIPAFLPVDGEASWSLLSSLVSLLSGVTVQPENTDSCILKVTGQVWENRKRISSNTNHSYHHCLSPSVRFTDLITKSDSVLTKPIEKYGVQGWSMLENIYPIK